jgi:hypothetical protein
MRTVVALALLVCLTACKDDCDELTKSGLKPGDLVTVKLNGEHGQVIDLWCWDVSVRMSSDLRTRYFKPFELNK